MRHSPVDIPVFSAQDLFQVLGKNAEVHRCFPAIDEFAGLNIRELNDAANFPGPSLSRELESERAQFVPNSRHYGRSIGHF